MFLLPSLALRPVKYFLLAFTAGLCVLSFNVNAADTAQAPAASSSGGTQAPAPAKPKPVVKKAVAEKSSGKPMVVTPTKRSDFAKGCGCGYFAPTSAREEGPLLLWLDKQGKAHIQIDGVKEELTLSSERMVRRRKDTDKLSAGDRVLITLKSSKAGNGLQASIASSVERNCTIAASQCSAPTFRSLISLSRGDSRKSLSAWSVCSCPGSSKPYTPPKPKPTTPSATPTVEPTPRPKAE